MFAPEIALEISLRESAAQLKSEKDQSIDIMTLDVSMTRQLSCMNHFCHRLLCYKVHEKSYTMPGA